MILDKNYSYRLINITDYFGRNIKTEDENNSRKIMRYRKWLEDNFFSDKAMEKKEFDNIIHEWNNSKKDIKSIDKWNKKDIFLFEKLLNIIEDDDVFKLLLEKYNDGILLNLLDDIRLIREKINFKKLEEKTADEKELNVKADKLINRIYNRFS
ncbi:8296_t:CDS:1 [Scutellospora calospora]|uniref:8296_t:CDS:1 n=1 Tax=Scutellospora calospora TaxID=85575 RepID=A0ACA9JUY5_9GLOM|nr:8296_t:CDS:1 [Scutellospora calospora]